MCDIEEHSSWSCTQGPRILQGRIGQPSSSFKGEQVGPKKGASYSKSAPLRQLHTKEIFDKHRADRIGNGKVLEHTQNGPATPYRYATVQLCNSVAAQVHLEGHISDQYNVHRFKYDTDIVKLSQDFVEEAMDSQT